MAHRKLRVIVGVISIIMASPLRADVLPLVEALRPGDERSPFVRELNRSLAQWNSIKRWLIEYEAVPFPTNGEFSPVHRVLAVAEPDQLYHLGAHFSPYAWQMDPFCQEFFIRESRTCHRWPFNRTYSEGMIKRGEDTLGLIPRDLMLNVMPRLPLDYYKIPAAASGARLLIGEALQSTDYRLSTQVETLCGEECVILENKGVDRIWLTSRKGVCVIRRDLRDSKSGKLVQRFLADRVTEVHKQLWLPTQLRSQFFSTSTGTNDNVIEREYRICVLRCVFDEDVPDSSFIPIHRAGSLKFEEDKHYRQVVPGGEDLLSDIADFLKSQAKVSKKLSSRHYVYAWVLAGIASGALFRLFVGTVGGKGITCSDGVSRP